MTDDTETPQKTPLSSSSSNPSGTQALSVSIEEDVQGRRAEAEGDEEASSTGEAATDEQEDAPAHDRTEFADAESDLSDIAVTDESAPFNGSADDHTQAEANSLDQDVAEDAAPEPQRHVDKAESETAVSSVSEPEPADVVSEAGEALRTVNTDASVEPEIAAGGAPSKPYEPGRSDIRVEINGLMSGEPTTEELREAVRNTLAERSVDNEKTFALFNQMSHELRAAMEDARDDAARVSFKLMEFAQASFHNNVELARDYATAKSVPDLFNVQSSYIQRQLQLLNSKTQELHALTNDIASKKAEKLQNRLKSD